MAVISKITLPDGSSYDLEDAVGKMKTSTNFQNLKYKDFENAKIIAGRITGNGTSNVALGIGSCDGPVSVRKASNGVMGIYNIDSGILTGWDGSTSRTFENGATYVVNGIAYK